MTSKQRAYLKSLAMVMDPIFQIGKSSLTPEVTEAINEALESVRKEGPLPVPLHLRNAPTKLMADLGYAKDYKYAHSYAGNFVDQEFLPEKLSGTRFYEPGQNAKENEMRKRLLALWNEKYNY